MPHVWPVAPVRRVRVQQVTGAGPGRPLDTGLLSAAGGWAVLHVRAAAAAAAGAPLTLQLSEQTSDGQWQPLNVSRRGHHHNRQPLLVLYSRDNRTAHHQTVNGERLCHSATRHLARGSPVTLTIRSVLCSSNNTAVCTNCCRPMFEHNRAIAIVPQLAICRMLTSCIAIDSCFVSCTTVYYIQ